MALLGANGNGKSTFCKLIGGRLAPLAGELRRSGKMDVAYFAQHQLDELRPAESAYAHVRDLMLDVPEARVRARRRPPRLRQPQGRHAGVAALRRREGAPADGARGFHAPHLLILDEPTNHLDIESRQP